MYHFLLFISIMNEHLNIEDFLHEKLFQPLDFWKNFYFYPCDL